MSRLYCVSAWETVDNAIWGETVFLGRQTSWYCVVLFMLFMVSKLIFDIENNAHPSQFVNTLLSAVTLSLTLNFLIFCISSQTSTSTVVLLWRKLKQIPPLRRSLPIITCVLLPCMCRCPCSCPSQCVNRSGAAGNLLHQMVLPGGAAWQP